MSIRAMLSIEGPGRISATFRVGSLTSLQILTASSPEYQAVIHKLNDAAIDISGANGLPLQLEIAEAGGREYLRMRFETDDRGRARLDLPDGVSAEIPENSAALELSFSRC